MKIDNNKKEHRNRKNPQANDLHKQANHDRNALRPKQVFVKDTNGGHWERGVVNGN
jgi:hypothetical protein